MAFDANIFGANALGANAELAIAYWLTALGVISGLTGALLIAAKNTIWYNRSREATVKVRQGLEHRARF